MLEHSVHLTYGDWTAVIIPSFGANTVRLRHGDKDLLRFPETMEELRTAPYLFGMPLLMPPNRTEDGMFTFDGRAYRLPINEPRHRNHIHGFMADAPFRVKRLSESQMTSFYENNGERYPFRFRMTVTSKLEKQGFFQQVDIANRSNADIPVMLGFHTAFLEPETFSVPIGKRWETNERHIPTGRLLELTEKERELRQGCRPGGLSISGFYTAAGHLARIGEYVYRTSDNFTQWVLFNGGGDQGYLCVEPQSGPVNGLNRPNGCIRLKKGESVQFWTAISRGGER